MAITSFDGENEFLSNFFESSVEYEGLTFKTNEHAFQAAKVLNIRTRIEFQILTPGQAKRKGRKVLLRSDWENVKDSIMENLVRIKFTTNEDLKRKLLNTDEEELIEGNNWHDTYWGICNGKGKNKLGKILMKVREELKG